MEPALYLIPAPLGDGPTSMAFAPGVLDVTRGLRAFAVETPKAARAHLKALGHPGPMAELTLIAMEDANAAARVIELLRAGQSVGVLSDAGCPGVADPGAALVRAAHQAAIPVRPLVGPSSLLLALMASGLNGQRFRFLGYLPVPVEERVAAIRSLEARSAQVDETQLFIETPYRNQALFESLVETLAANTWLCVAADLSLPGESVLTQRVSDWKQARPDLARRPAVFLVLAERAPSAAAPSRHGRRAR
jgi:16S rRNA (cytidine1402-2'-O)-methyltransferase